MVEYGSRGMINYSIHSQRIAQSSMVTTAVIVLRRYPLSSMVTTAGIVLRRYPLSSMVTTAGIVLRHYPSCTVASEGIRHIAKTNAMNDQLIPRLYIGEQKVKHEPR